ncbi:MAG TPA: NUDIX domain-containing protein [Candidatus Binatia bacterium]|nr:NUDIX domain-containing protein [Candidatus Binatia bacterium]
MLARVMSSSAPAVPRPSSTVILLRDEPGGAPPFSVLLLERHGSIAFPGATAFPGGVVDAGDARGGDARLPAEQRWAPAGEGDGPSDALGYWVAALRELFEEVGILLATHDGAPLGGPLSSAVAALRARVHAGEPFADVLASAGLVPATDRLFYFARWITPVVNPRRWDTRFLVGRLPPGQEAVVDGTETVSCGWMTPRDALAAYEAGRITLIPPTVRTLDDLARFPSADAVLADAAARIVRGLTPELVQSGALTAIQYPDNTGSALPPRRLVLRDGRWRPAESDR